MTQSTRPPTRPTNGNDGLSFRVWAHCPVVIEDKKPWKVVAEFRYLLECLDYLDYCHKRGVSVVFQSPKGVEVEQ